MIEQYSNTKIQNLQVLRVDFLGLQCYNSATNISLEGKYNCKMDQRARAFCSDEGKTVHTGGW